MSIEYSVGVAYGIVVPSDSDIALEIIAAYCDPENPRLEEIRYDKLGKDYPSIRFDTSTDQWSGSIKNNVIFFAEGTFQNINPRDGSYDAFYVKELDPSDEAKAEINEFVSRFGIEDAPGICIWSSVF